MTTETQAAATRVTGWCEQHTLGDAMRALRFESWQIIGATCQPYRARNVRYCEAAACEAPAAYVRLVTYPTNCEAR